MLLCECSHTRSFLHVCVCVGVGTYMCACPPNTSAYCSGVDVKACVRSYMRVRVRILTNKRWHTAEGHARRRGETTAYLLRSLWGTRMCDMPRESGASHGSFMAAVVGGNRDHHQSI